MNLHRAYARFYAAWQHAHGIARRDAPAPQAAGNHGARAFNGERAVDGHAQKAFVVGVLLLRYDIRERGFQLVEASALACGNGNDFRVGVGAAGERRMNLPAHEFDPFFVDHIAFGEGDDDLRNRKQAQHGKMLARLRHDTVVSCDNQNGRIDARGSSDHLAHEFLMARHVDDADRGATRKVESRKTQLTGDASAFFLDQTIGVGAGERLHERRFAVVDVTRGANDD